MVPVLVLVLVLVEQRWEIVKNKGAVSAIIITPLPLSPIYPGTGV